MSTTPIPERITFTFSASEQQRLALAVAALYCIQPIEIPGREGLWIYTSIDTREDTVHAEASRYGAAA